VLENAVQLAEKANDIPSLFLINYFLGATHYWCANFQEAIRHLQIALEVNLAARSLVGVATMTSWIGQAHTSSGKIDLGYQESREAVRVSEESGDSTSKSQSYMFHGFSCFRKGFFQEAEESLLKGIGFGDRIKMIGFVGWAHQWIADTYYETGEHSKSIHHSNEAIRYTELNKWHPSLVHLCATCATRSRVIVDGIDAPLESLRDIPSRNKMKLFEGPIRRNIAATLSNAGDYDAVEAEDWIRKAIEFDKKNGLRWDLAMDCAVYGELLLRTGEASRARENLNQAIDMFRECGADGWVQRTEERLAEL
jgi:tetratricopeptide (TPR) repeat protein